MKRYSIIILLILGFFTVRAYSADKVTIAILDLSSKGVPKIVSGAISDIVRSEFVNIGNFTVVERSQMNAILKEQGLQMTGCTDSSCAVQFGKLLSARRIVIGEVSKVGNGIFITARYVNVENGESLFSASDKANSIDVVDKAANRVAKSLASKIISGDKEIITPKTAGGYYFRSIIPGWGQFYAENDTKGFVYSFAFGAAAVLTGVSALLYSNAKNDYEGIGRDESLDSIKNKRDDYDTTAKYVNISIGLAAAVYVVHWVDALFFSKADFDKLIAADYKDNSSSISFNVYRKLDINPEKKMELSYVMKF